MQEGQEEKRRSLWEPGKGSVSQPAGHAASLRQHMLMCEPPCSGSQGGRWDESWIRLHSPLARSSEEETYGTRNHTLFH